MNLLRLIAIALLSAALICGTWTPARADTDQEMVIKAVMIRKFVEFIKWPEDVAPQKEMQVKVCVYGDTPMAQMNAVFNKTSATSPIKYTLSSISQLGNISGACHVLFIAASKQDSSVFAALEGKPVLTVSDAGGFADKGGMIGFEIIEGKVRYNINNKAFGQAHIKVDAQLLEIANKVVD